MAYLLKELAIVPTFNDWNFLQISSLMTGSLLVNSVGHILSLLFQAHCRAVWAEPLEENNHLNKVRFLFPFIIFPAVLFSREDDNISLI